MARPSQIYTEMISYLEAMIVNGTFPPGTKLPSQRQLGAQFNLPQCTVGRKLKELEERGLIELKRGSGAYVKERRRIARPVCRIGVIIEAVNLQISYCGHVLVGLQERAEELSCLLNLNFVNYRETSPELLSKYAARQDGLILLGCYDTALESLPPTRPCVGTNMHRNFGFASTIDLDPVRAAELACMYFLERGKKTVHLFAYDDESSAPRSAFAWRGRTFAAYWAPHGKLIVHATAIPNVIEGRNDPQYFTDPDAGYLFTSGTRAEGAARAYLQQTGRMLYDDFCVLTIDGKSLLRPDYFPVDTISTDYPAMGREAMNECFRRIREPGAGPQRIYRNVFLNLRQNGN